VVALIPQRISNTEQGIPNFKVGATLCGRPYSPKNIEYRTRNIEFRSRGDPVWSPLYFRPESRIHNVSFCIEFAGHSGIWVNFVGFQPQEVYNCVIKYFAGDRR